MKFGRKGKNTAARGGDTQVAPHGGMQTSRGGAPVRPSQRSMPSELGSNSGADGLPGKAGWPNGPRTELPTFFATRRPDGRPEPVYKKKRFFG